MSEAAHIGRVAPAPHGPIGRLLEAVCRAVAMLGGLLLIAIMLILVGAFTKNLSVRARAGFDLAANLLFLLLSFALAFQLGIGTREKFANHDTTMVLRFPEGWAYAAALAFAWL